MKTFFKNRIVTIIILIATLVLAGIAIFTAIRLYQLRQEAVAPSVPTSMPKAAVPSSCTQLAFTISLASPSPSPSLSPSPSPSGSPVASPSPSPSGSPTVSPTPASCNNGCSKDTDCATGLFCSGGACRNPSCSAETDCTCAISGASPTASPSLPEAGVSYPTIVGAGLGILVILGAILLAL